MTRKLIRSELRDDCGAVFLSEYPEEGDVIGWLKVHRMNDPMGIFSGRWADDAVQLIESLQQVLDAARNEPHRTPRLENAIRAFDARHNDRVEGRDAASSRRVPSHDGLGQEVAGK